MRTKEGNTQCERAVSEAEPWSTQAITTGTNCFPLPDFSPLETWLRPPAPPPSGRGLSAEGTGARASLLEDGCPRG